MTPESLKAWRERMGWTKAHAAFALELSPNGYAALEAGHWRGDPRPIRRHIEYATYWLEHVYGATANAQSNLMREP